MSSRLSAASTERIIRNTKQWERFPKNNTEGMFGACPPYHYPHLAIASVTCDAATAQISDLSLISHPTCTSTVSVPCDTGGYMSLGSTTIYNPTTLQFVSEWVLLTQIGVRWYIVSPVRPMMLYYTLTEDLAYNGTASATTMPDVGTIEVALENDYIESNQHFESGTKGFCYRHRAGYYLVTANTCPVEV